jgi:hypothetical protein
MSITRRELLRAGAAAGALLLAGPVGAAAAQLASVTGTGASRASRLFSGTRLVHSDLHNHSLLSDGQADPEEAFASMRSAGLDVAALTDHAVMGQGPLGSVCTQGDCTPYVGINEESWQRIARLADDADDPGAFTALRGFEWTTGTLGHINVWFSEHWIDAQNADALITPKGFPQFVGIIPGAGPVLRPAVDEHVEPLLPETSDMETFYAWLATPSEQGGGADALAGFNHPNSWGNFAEFAYQPAVAERLVSMEMFTMTRDYFFQGTDDGQAYPLSACLNAGWRVGLLGVSDEHGPVLGTGEGKGRGGLWVRDFSREGVREALLERAMFATTVSGLRLDAAAVSASGGRVRMGRTLGHRGGGVTFQLDIDRGPEWVGKPLQVQVLRPGDDAPLVAEVVDVTVPSDEEPVISLRVEIDPDEGDWVVLRVTDPALPPDPRATGDYAAVGAAVAYSSPFYLDPDAAR